jgi:hypothetical protein
MASVVVNGDTSGAVTLSAPAVAGTVTVTLPAASGTMASLASVTANGVAYVNSSGQPTSGSALAFNGSKLGIGVSSFDVPLQVQAITGGLAMRFNGRASPADGYSDIGFYNSANTTQFAGIGAANSGLFFATNIATPIQFQINNAEAGRFDASGNLLVGKTSTSDTVIGTIQQSTGRIASAMAATVNGIDTLTCYSTGAGAYRFYVGMGGTVFATSTTISAISDARFKENVRELDAGLSEVMALKPRLYDWKEGKGANTKNARGFIAQEFEEVFPDLIDEWKDPAPEGEEPYKSVRQDLIPVLVKAIQEQQALITTLTARITALESA